MNNNLQYFSWWQTAFVWLLYNIVLNDVMRADQFGWSIHKPFDAGVYEYLIDCNTTLWWHHQLLASLRHGYPPNEDLDFQGNHYLVQLDDGDAHAHQLFFPRCLCWSDVVESSELFSVFLLNSCILSILIRESLHSLTQTLRTRRIHNKQSTCIPRQAWTF